MCQIIVKKEGQKFDMGKLDIAQGWNGDGYGVTWWENKELQTFKTMDYNRFKAILSTLKAHKAVAHLRNTTRGKTCTDNNHPFDVPSGKLFHNGTIYGVECGTQGGSDTQALAEMITECDYRFIEDITPMITHIVGDKLNKLVFFEDDGRITYVNKHLGLEEDGIWYSNDYHKKTMTRAENAAKTYSGGKTQVYNPDTGLFEDIPSKTDVIKTTPVNKPKQLVKKDKKLTRVFVYGTLKAGHNNHTMFLKDATFIGKATTVTKWAMIGQGMGFPYVLHRDNEGGHKIVGEVYEVTQQELMGLDMLEGIDNGHYKHSVAYVSYINGKPSENVNIYIKGTVTLSDMKRPYIAEFVKAGNRVAI